MEQHRARKGERRLGEFLFERIGPDRVEHIGFDYQYGDEPDVWVMFGLWTGENGVCTFFCTGNCANYSDYKKPPWRSLVDWLRRPPPPADPLAHALEKGLERLGIIEEFFKTGVPHPDCNVFPGRPGWWPDRGPAKA